MVIADLFSAGIPASIGCFVIPDCAWIGSGGGGSESAFILYQ